MANIIADFIADSPPQTRKLMRQLRAVIRRAAPKATEAIKWQMATYVLEGNLVHFAGLKKHVGFFPGPAAIQKFHKQFGGRTWSKGTLQLPLDEPLPVGLITKMVKFQVQRHKAKAKAASRGKRRRT